MKVLAVHRYYWPDSPPYASLLREILLRWVEDGHDVNVLTSQPSYKRTSRISSQPKDEYVDGIRVRRLNLPNETLRPFVRITNALRLGICILWHALIVRRYDVIMISTSPPIIGGICAAIAAKITGAKFIYHCMDLHPEVGVLTGETKNPLVLSVLSKMDQWTCRQAAQVVVLSRDMADTLLIRDADSDIPLKILNNFSLPGQISDSEVTKSLKRGGEFLLIFAGNIGRFQGLDSLIDAMGLLQHKKEVRLIMLGDGTEKEYLRAKAENLGANVSFLDQRSIGETKSLIAGCSLGVVSLTPKLYQCAYPSKTMTYLEQGCPLLVMVEPESHLAVEVESANAGKVCDRDPIALRNMIEELAEDRVLMESMSLKAFQLSKELFDRERALNEWSALIAAYGE